MSKLLKAMFLVGLILTTISATLLVVHISKSTPDFVYIQIEPLADYCIFTIDCFSYDDFNLSAYFEQYGQPTCNYNSSLKTLSFQFFTLSKIDFHPNITIVSLSLTIVDKNCFFTYNNLIYTHLTFEINACIPYFEINNLVFYKMEES